MKSKVLIIDDDESIRSQLKWALDEDYEVLLAQDRTSGVAMFRASRPEVSLLDLGLPPHTDNPTEGLAALASIRMLDRTAKVIVVSGQTERETALRAVGQGACDYLCKPLQIGELKLLLHRCSYVTSLEREYRQSQQRLAGETFEGMQGRSPQMREVFAYIRKAAPTETSVLILGESGTGKEMAAAAIHRRSFRADAPFVVVNCGAIPEDLIESELFGHEPDVFADGCSQRPGRIESAVGGTVFLDQVGELPLSSQVRLLRFLQENAVERVGGRQPVRVDARLLAATSTDLTKAMAEGRFRDDLYYRLAVVVIRMPPLRVRKEDIQMLAQVFLQQFSAEYHRQTLNFDPEALRLLEQHPWPGNVRELENCVKRAVIMADGDCVQAHDLELLIRLTPASAGSLREARQSAEREKILQALQKHHGKIAPAAQELGISRPTFYALIHKLGIRRHSDPSEESPEFSHILNAKE